MSGTAPPTATTPTGVHTRAWNATGGGDVFLTLPTAVATISAGYRFYRTVNANDLMIRFVGTTGTDEHIDVQYVAGGNFGIYRNVSTQLALSTGGHISLNTQYYIEITATIDDSAGSFTCKLYNDSGTLLETLTASGVDTRDNSATVNQVIFGGTGYWEDAWIDDTGELYGPAQAEYTPPNGAGALAQLTRGGTNSGANWSQVDEVPYTTNDHNISTGADQYDCYTFGARSVTGTPIAVGVQANGGNVSGSPQFNFFCRIGGVNYEHTDLFTSNGNPGSMFASFWRNNPATGIAWTDSEINAAEFGIRWRATNGFNHILGRVTLVKL